MLAKGRVALRNFFFAETDARPLALFRIALGLLLLVEAVLVYPALTDLYGPRGFLDATLMRALAGRNLPYYADSFAAVGISYAALLQGVFWIRALAILGFLAGLFTGPATFVLWLTQTFFMASGALSSYGLDRYFHLFLFIMLFFPAGARYSLDAIRRGRRDGPRWQNRFGLRLLQLALLLTYLNAGLAKATGPEWWTGDAVWRALHLPEFRQAEFWWMGDYPLVPKLLARSTLFFEAFYILGVWIPYLGILWVLVIIAMHLGILVFMNLANFGFGMMLFNAVLFLYPRGRSWIQQAANRRRLVYLAGSLAPARTAAFVHRGFRETRRYPRPKEEEKWEATGEPFAPLPGIRALFFPATDGDRNAPAILLAHGWGGRGTQLGYFLEPLRARGFAVYTFDGPGHGESSGDECDLAMYVEVIRALRDRAGAFHGVVGHSFGAVAAAYAAARDGGIGRLVLIGAPASLEGALRYGEEAGLPPKARGLFRTFVEARAGVRLGETKLAELGRAGGVPALLVHDEGDRIVPFAAARMVAEEWPGATLLVTRGLGHQRVLKDGGVIAEVVNWLAD